MTLGARWSVERAVSWYDARPWLVGCNFIPSTAVNQLEMWQEETFDPVTIDRELGWAAALGMNSVRVFLRDLLWNDPAGFKRRIEKFLGIPGATASQRCSCSSTTAGTTAPGSARNPAPVPGRHNSRWLQSPGHSIIADPSALPRLEAYVKGVITAFGSDERVLVWDLDNEVTNGFLPGQALAGADRDAAFAEAARRRSESMPAHLRLLDLSFEWARAAKPAQPLTAGAFLPDRDLNARLADLSDVITTATKTQTASKR